MKKILSMFLALVMLLSMTILTASADTEAGGNWNGGTKVSYNAEDPDGDGVLNNTESYTVTVPSQLAPGTGGEVVLSGTWASDRMVTVTADKEVVLKNSINKDNTKTLAVTFTTIEQEGSNTSTIEVKEDVSVVAIANAIFGTWSGTFNYFVSITDIETKDENYIGSVLSDNTILLNGLSNAGTYTLRYANENGALENYSDICTITINNNGDPGSYNHLIEENCAPIEASTIAVYDEAGGKVGDIALGGLKTELGTKLYSFGAISDVHIGYQTSEMDLQNALTYLSNAEGVDFIGIAGDLTSSATDAELTKYKNIVDSYASVPVYAVTGNHDTEKYRGENVSSIIENYTGLPSYYSFTRGNDVFIMLGVENEETGAHLADGELQWLYETLEENRNKRCFIFTHVYPNNSSGDPSNIYGFDLWAGVEEQVFTSMLKHYPNLTIFHGHSHVEFALQSLNKNSTIHTSSGYNSIHIPSITAPRTGELNGESIIGSYLYEASEGYVVDVYENGIVLRGRDFANEKFLPIAQYYIGTPIRSVAAGTYTDETGTINVGATNDGVDIIYNMSNATSSNEESKISNGQSFSTIITPDWGYEIEQIVVMMGGSDITDSAVSGSTINIESVIDTVCITTITKYITINLVDIVGYSENTRMSQATGELKTQEGCVATTGYVALEPGAVYRIQGLDLSRDKDHCMIVFYDSSFAYWVAALFGPDREYPFNFTSDEHPMANINCDENGDLIITISEDLFNDASMSSGRYFRICGYGSDENFVITKNQDLPK